MALEKRLTQVALTGGLSTRVDPYQIPFNKLAAAKDVIFSTPGELRTRPGYRALPKDIVFPIDGTTGLLTSGRALIPYENELVLCDAFRLFSYDAGQRTFVYKGPCTSMNVTDSAVIQDTLAQQAADENVAPNGLRLDAWEDQVGGCFYQVTDTNTGTVVVPRQKVDNDNAAKPKVLLIGSLFAVLYVRKDLGQVWLGTVPTGNIYQGLSLDALTGTGTPNEQLNATNPNYDAVVATTNAGQVLYLAFCNSVAAGGAGITTLGYTPSGLVATLGPTPVYGPKVQASVTPQALAIFSDTITVAGPNSINGPVVMFYDGTDVQIFGYSYSLAADTIPLAPVNNVPVTDVQALTGISTAVDLMDTGQARALDLYFTVGDTDTWKTATWTAQVLGDTVASGTPQRLSVGLAGKAFAIIQDGQSRSYVPVAYQSQAYTTPGLAGLQDTYFVMDWSGYICARFYYGTAGGLPAGAGIGPDPLSPYGAPMLPETWKSNPLTVGCALLGTDFLTTFAKTTPAPGTTTPLTAIFTQDGVRSLKFEFFNPQKSYLNAQLGGTLLLAGGLLQSYDGQTLVENGFSLTPENITLAQSATMDGHLTLLATYFYTFVYQWTNAKGELEQSGPSIPISITLSGSNNTVTAEVPTMRMSNKRGISISIVAFRSVSTGTVYHQATTTTLQTLSPATNAPVQNDRFSDTVTFIDQMADTALAATPELYTTGGVIENLPTPPCSDLTVNYNRVFALGMDGVIWFSQQVLPGEPVEMSEWLFFNVDPRGGKTTALHALGQHTILFKEALIMGVDGIGPDNTGGQGNFGEAYIVTTDVGCIYPRSISLGEKGLYFQSGKGLYLLNESPGVFPIGVDVDALVNGRQITSTQLLTYTQQMRFTLDDGTLVGHDYLVDQWFQHTNINAVDSAIWQGTYCYLRPDGQVLVENVPPRTASIVEAAASFTDAGKFLGLSIVTPWFNLAGLSGWARTWWVHFLCKVYNQCTLRVDIAYDYDPSTKQTVYVDIVPPGPPYGQPQPYGTGTYGGQMPNVAFRVQPNQQLSTALQLTFTVLQKNGIFGEGLSLSSLTFEWGQARTPRRPNSSATYG